MEPCAVPSPPPILPVNTDGRFPFQAPHDIGHTILGGNAQTQMHIVGHGMPLNQFDAHLIAEFPQDLANVLAECAKDCFLPILRYDDNVVSAIPPDMAVVVPFSHDVVSPSHSLGGSMVGETISLIPCESQSAGGSQRQ